MRIALFLVAFISLMSCNSTTNEESNVLPSKVAAKTSNKILFVVSNQGTYGNLKLSAYNHFAEIVLAYDEFVKGGFSVDFVSPEGGAIPVGYIDTLSNTQKRYLEDEAFTERLKNTKSPEAITASDYKAIYYSGGGSAMFGVPENEAIQKIAMEIYEEHQGIVSAICHGSAGLVNLKTKDGKYIYEGKKVNGYPDKFENMEDEYYQSFPFSIEKKLMERGGDFQYSKEGWDDFSQVDGRLITGQDPTATRSVAKLIIEKLKPISKS